MQTERLEAVALPIRLVESIGRAGRTKEEAADVAEIAWALCEEHDQWGLPKDWLAKLAAALENGRWDLLTKPFLDLEFLGAAGTFLIVGPYTIKRGGEVETLLSGLYGRVVPHPPMPPMDPVLREIFGAISQPVTRILPISALASCGNLGSEAGEAFIVPDGWGFPGAAGGPALNDMDEQARRFSEAGRECLRRIFDGKTAELLLAPYAERDAQIQLQHQEYQFHEAGHASGIGLTRKLCEEMLTTPWHGAVEEWRSDGVAFEVAARLLPEKELGRLVASNFCTRFGVDAHRTGGPERDRDVAAVLLTLDHLLRSGALLVREGKLALADPSYRGLARSTVPHRIEAVRLTEAEMALASEAGMPDRYAGVGVAEESRVLFDKLVRVPCRGLYKELR